MEQQTFSQKLKRLEEVVAKLESPDVELEEGLKLLEEGVSLHKECQQMLSQTQAKITKLLDNQSALSPVEVAEDNAETSTRKEPKPTDEAVSTLFDAADVPTPTETVNEESDNGLPF